MYEGTVLCVCVLREVGSVCVCEGRLELWSWLSESNEN